MAARCEVMGVVNATPDSFFEPSRGPSPAEAVRRAAALLEEGADIVDVGGESTRPGAAPVQEQEELARVIPVIEALRGARISIDTVKPGVARAAVAAGATLLNDVGGSLAPVAAELGVGWVAMHHRGIPAAGSDRTVGTPVVAEVLSHVLRAAREARALGVSEIYVDPGIGFGKGAHDNLLLVAHLEELCSAAHEEGFKVLVGASRKRFLGALPNGRALEVTDRFEGSLAVATYAMVCGVDMVRVHDVRATVEAATLVADREAA